MAALIASKKNGRFLQMVAPGCGDPGRNACPRTTDIVQLTAQMQLDQGILRENACFRYRQPLLHVEKHGSSFQKVKVNFAAGLSMFPQSSKRTCFQHFSNIFRKKECLLILLSQGWSCLWHGRRLPAQRNILGIGSTFREMRCKLRSMPLSGNLDSGPVWKGGIRSQKGHWHGKSWKIMTYTSNLWVTILFPFFP